MKKNNNVNNVSRVKNVKKDERLGSRVSCHGWKTSPPQHTLRGFDESLAKTTRIRVQVSSLPSCVKYK